MSRRHKVTVTPSDVPSTWSGKSPSFVVRCSGSDCYLGGEGMSLEREGAATSLAATHEALQARGSDALVIGLGSDALVIAVAGLATFGSLTIGFLVGYLFRGLL